jgi:hypothetical protein
MKGLTTYLPNAKGRDSPASTIAAASAAPHVLLLPAYHISESADDEIEVIIVPPALPPMDAVPPGAARIKKKRKEAAALAASGAASNNESTAAPTPSIAPATKKGKMTSKKKAARPIDLCTTPMWAKTTNGANHCIMAIAHKKVLPTHAEFEGESTNQLNVVNTLVA